MVSHAAAKLSALTLALGDARRPIKVCGGVARAGDAIVLPKLCLIGAQRAADAAML